MAVHSRARLFVLKKGNGATPTEVFTTVASLVDVSFAGTTGVDDITTKEDNQWSAQAAGRMSAQVTANGIVRDNNSYTQLMEAWATREESNYQVIGEDGYGFKGPFLITAFNTEGGTDGAQRFSVTLQNMGEVTQIVPPTTP